MTTVTGVVRFPVAVLSDAVATNVSALAWALGIEPFQATRTIVKTNTVIGRIVAVMLCPGQRRYGARSRSVYCTLVQLGGHVCHVGRLQLTLTSRHTKVPRH